MVTTATYATREYSPAPSAKSVNPSARLRRPKPKSVYADLSISDRDLDFLTDYLNVSAHYVEDLEDRIGEELLDFWETREHALKIITDLLIQKAEQEEHAPAEVTV